VPDFLAYCAGHVTAIAVELALETADQIQIAELELFARIGVTDEERAASQRLSATITLWPDQHAEQLRDLIKRAVDYSEVCEKVHHFAKTESFALLETMAAEMTSLLLGSFPIRGARIELRKFVLSDAKHVAAIVTRFGKNA
jgi:dihydroneopterin aldolase